MGIRLTFQRNRLSRGKPGSWWLAKPAEPSESPLLLSPGMISGVESCLYMRAAALDAITACSIIYSPESGLISLQCVCLVMLCFSEKPEPEHPSEARAEAEQVELSCPSVRRRWPERRSCWREVDDVGGAVLWFQGLGVYLKSWKWSRSLGNENQTTRFATDVVSCGETVDRC